MAERLGVYLRLAAASVRATTRRPAYLAVRTVAAGLIVVLEVAGVAVASQVAWVVVLWLGGRLVLALASRRLVVHGG